MSRFVEEKIKQLIAKIIKENSGEVLPPAVDSYIELSDLLDPEPFSILLNKLIFPALDQQQAEQLVIAVTLHIKAMEDPIYQDLCGRVHDMVRSVKP